MTTAWLILGASSSVARAFAREVAHRGCDVILAGRDLDDLGRTAADIRVRTGQRAEVVPFNALSFDEHEALAQRCRQLGVPFNVFLVFGLMPPQDALETDPALLRQTIEVNFVGAASVLGCLAPILESQGRGRVAILSSVAGDRGRFSNYIYGSAKAGLNAYAQGLRARLFRSGVTVTTIKAGFMDTAMTFGLPGMFLVAQPSEAARAILRAAEKGKEVIYFPWFWKWIMLIIKLIPERVFKRLSI